MRSSSLFHILNRGAQLLSKRDRSQSAGAQRADMRYDLVRQRAHMRLVSTSALGARRFESSSTQKRVCAFSVNALRSY